jgi:hypothetical protein
LSSRGAGSLFCQPEERRSVLSSRGTGGLFCHPEERGDEGSGRGIASSGAPPPRSLAALGMTSRAVASLVVAMTGSVLRRHNDRHCSTTGVQCAGLRSLGARAGSKVSTRGAKVCSVIPRSEVCSVIPRSEATRDLGGGVVRHQHATSPTSAPTQIPRCARDDKPGSRFARRRNDRHYSTADSR